MLREHFETFSKRGDYSFWHEINHVVFLFSCYHCDANYDSFIALETHKYESNHWSDQESPLVEEHLEGMIDQPEFPEDFGHDDDGEAEREFLLM